MNRTATLEAPRRVKTAEAARITGVSQQTIRNRIHTGQLRAWRLGRFLFVDLAEVEQLFQLVDVKA